MAENFEESWGKWEKANQDLWNKGVNFGIGDLEYGLSNVEALVNCVLRPKEPIRFMGKTDQELIGITIEFNKRLGNNNGTFEDNFSNNNLKGAAFEAQNITITKVIIKQRDNQKQITRKDFLNKLSKEQIIKNDNKVDMSKLLNMIKEYLNNDLQNNGKQPLDNISISNIKLSPGGTLTVTLSTSSKEMDDFFLFAFGDKLKNLWYATYRPIINESLKSIMDDLSKKVGNKIQESVVSSKEVKFNDSSEELLTKQEKTIKTLEWITNIEIQERIKEILNRVTFYKDNEDRKNAFIGFFKDQIQKKSINYFTTTGIYPETFGGDFGEVDSLVRTAFAMGKSRSRNSNQYGKIDIEMLTNEKTISQKKVPADGKITFNYNCKSYTCTFQSKNYSLSTLQRALYGNDSFTLVPAEDSNTVDSNIHKTNLYSYDKDTLNIGYNMLKAHNEKTKERKESFNNLKDGGNYIGAVPGLARIKTYVGDDITGKSDFYYFSGYFIPSFLFLRLIGEKLKEQEKKSLINITVTTTRKNSYTITKLKGNLNQNSNPYDVLKRFK